MDGFELERVFKQGLQGKVAIIDTGHTAADLYEGTDLIVQYRDKNYRVDPTWDFHYKETHGMTEQIGRSATFVNKGLMLDVQYGYRTHNGRRFLPEPTLVIGIKDYSRNLEREELWAIDAFKELAKDILDRGVELYNERELIPQIKENPWVIEDIKNHQQTRKMKEVAIEYCPQEEVAELAWVIGDPDDVVQQLAVRKNGLAIAAFIKPSEVTQLYAIQQNPDAYECIDNPTEKVTEEYHKIVQQKEQETLQEQLDTIKEKMSALDPTGKEDLKEYAKLAEQRRHIQQELKKFEEPQIGGKDIVK